MVCPMVVPKNLANLELSSHSTHTHAIQVVVGIQVIVGIQPMVDIIGCIQAILGDSASSRDTASLILGLATEDMIILVSSINYPGRLIL